MTDDFAKAGFITLSEEKKIYFSKELKDLREINQIFCEGNENNNFFIQAPTFKVLIDDILHIVSEYTFRNLQLMVAKGKIKVKYEAIKLNETSKTVFVEWEEIQKDGRCKYEVADTIFGNGLSTAAYLISELWTIQNNS